eukprot:5700229-Pyramimonas_sp.AAC.1
MLCERREFGSLCKRRSHRLDPHDHRCVGGHRRRSAGGHLGSVTPTGQSSDGSCLGHLWCVGNFSGAHSDCRVVESA